MAVKTPPTAPSIVFFGEMTAASLPPMNVLQNKRPYRRPGAKARPRQPKPAFHLPNLCEIGNHRSAISNPSIIVPALRSACSMESTQPTMLPRWPNARRKNQSSRIRADEAKNCRCGRSGDTIGSQGCRTCSAHRTHGQKLPQHRRLSTRHTIWQVSPPT